MEMEIGDGEVGPATTTLINRGTSECRQPLLQFHSVHGDNITLLKGAKQAKRAMSFCKGVVFTNRFACPDLTSQGGFWCKALPERFSVQERVLHFMVDKDGNLRFGMNGVDRGIFITKISIRGQLWGLFDIYGNSRSIEFLDSNVAGEQSRSPFSLDLIQRDSSTDSTEDEDPERRDLSDDDIKLHHIHSSNVRVSPNGVEASRMGSDFRQAYIFSSRPIRIAEKIVNNDSTFNGSMAFGLTSCDPASINVDDLPRDSDNLLDRPEYWTCIKNVAVNPIAHETVTFWVEEFGEVMFSKNGRTARSIMFVDTSVPLWMFFDLYGSTVKVRVINSEEISSRPRPLLSQSPVELNVVTAPPRRSSSNDVNRWLSDVASVRVQLPPVESASRRASPSVRRSPLQHDSSGDTTDQNALNESLISDIAESIQNVRDRTRRFRDAQRALELEQQQLAQLSTIRSLSSALRDIPVSDSPRLSSSSGRRRPNSTSEDVIPPLRVGLPVGRNLGPLYASDDSTVRSTSQSRSSPTNSPTWLSYARRNLDMPASSSVGSGLSALNTQPVLSPSLSLTVPSATVASTVPTTQSSISTPTPSRISPETNLGTSESDKKIPDGGINSECVVCMNERVNAVLYRCGHLCMCFVCAREMMDSGRNCPLCRQVILDVIRCYSS